MTGFCDSHDRRRSMHDVAREIGMPASFVELRHEATHKEVPNLERLKRNVEAALQWLWNYYWKHLDDPPPSLDAPFDQSGLLSELRSSIESYVASRKTEIRSSAATLPHESVHAKDALRSCVQACNVHSASLPVLISLLVDEGMMFPATALRSHKQ